MAEVFFNVGQGARTAGRHVFDSPKAVRPDPGEIVAIELAIPPSQLTDPQYSCTMTLYRSRDQQTWELIARARFTGHPENVDAPSIGVDAEYVDGYYVRSEIVVDRAMNVGFKMHSREQFGASRSAGNGRPKE